MNNGYGYITRANRGRRYPINRDKLADEARYLTTTILWQRADTAVRRCQEETVKAVVAYHKRHEQTRGPTGWREIARGRVHSAGIADQHAKFYRELVAYRHAGSFEYLGLPELENSCYLTAQEQTHVNNAKLLAETIRNTKHDGRHDGLGNPILAVGFYQKWAIEACDGIEWLLAQVESRENQRASEDPTSLEPQPKEPHAQT